MIKTSFQTPDRPFRLAAWIRVGSAILLSSALLGGISLLSMAQAIAANPDRSLPSFTALAQLQSKQVSPEEPIPLAIVQPNGDTITIQIVNATGADLSYQVIGDTQVRVLGAQAEVSLQDLSIPTTVTFRRNDGGLVSATIEANNPAGTLTLILQQNSDLGIDRTALRIEPTGAVYLN